MKPNFRTLLSILSAAGLFAAAAPAALAQGDWPSKPITMVLPYPPGGLADALSRRLSARLSELWKVSIVVDSRPGAGGLLGAGLVAKAPEIGRAHV